MIRSMTSFAREAVTSEHGTLTWELRSVNHRYLDVSLRLPEGFRHLESVVRETVAAHIKRGKCDVTLKFSPGTEVPVDIQLNYAMLQQLSEVSMVVQQKMPSVQSNVTDILSWPGVLHRQVRESDEQDKYAIAQLKKTIQAMIVAREREGQKITDFLLQRLDLITRQVAIVESKLPGIIDAECKAIRERFEAFQLQVDPERLEQEMVWLMQKMDVAEELQRLQGHLSEVSRLLQQGGVLGRRLDFMMQELNREANTLSSKSVSTVVTQAAVEIKVLIEQMREQVQNIE